MAEALGIYLSIPFCRAKCTFCNFASGAFGPERMQRYVDQLCIEIARAQKRAVVLGAVLPDRVDSIYFGGGTPSLLEPAMARQIFTQLRGEFLVEPDAEITLECAPGQLAEETLDAFLSGGVGRVSFGVQSFVDRESASVGRMHTREQCLAEILRMRLVGISQRSLDLIVGLPHQTETSWRYSVDEAINSGVEHVSVYMLEVDEKSRLGREILQGSNRYSSATVPDDDAVADWYEWAASRLNHAGIEQYEISNFARKGCVSRHNTKYWERRSYIGFGLDAHSFLSTGEGAVRWSNPDSMDSYLGSDSKLPVVSAQPGIDWIRKEQAFEETLFLGLRMNKGVDLFKLREQFGLLAIEIENGLQEVEAAGLVLRRGSVIRLTDAGRMLSNEVFGRLLLAER